MRLTHCLSLGSALLICAAPSARAEVAALASASLVPATGATAPASCASVPATGTTASAPMTSAAAEPSDDAADEPTLPSGPAEPVPGASAAPPSAPSSPLGTPSGAPPPAPGAIPPPGPDRGRLRGEVSFSRQEPALGAAVILMREGDPSRLAIGTTDAHGYFRFESIPGGRYTLGVIKEGGEPVLKTGIDVTPPMRSVVDILLKKQEGKWEAPPIDLARFDTSTGADSTGVPASGENPTPTGSAPASSHAGGSPGQPGAPSADGSDDAARRMTVHVVDVELEPIREARILLRSRGPAVDPVRAISGADGRASLGTPAPGEYFLRVAVPGFLPLRIDRLVLGPTAPTIYAVLTPRPLDYPASPAELLPEEKPVPPPGFPGSADRKTNS